MIARRTALVAIATLVASPRLALAQAQPAQVAVLFAGDADDDEPIARAFFDELRRLGWIEGRNIAFELLSGRGMRDYVDRLASHAADLNPSLIYATTATIALAAARITDTVPIVFTTTSDPAASALTELLARPGRNTTGSYHATGDALHRRLSLAKELLPKLTRIGMLLDRRGIGYEDQSNAYPAAARRAGLELAVVEFTNYEAIAKILSGFRRDGITTLTLGSSFTLFARRRDIALAAARSELAIVAHRVEWAEAGALLTYGPDVADSQLRAARIANRILKGGAPGSIPAEQSTKFQLVLNRRTAVALGIAIPPALQKRADRIVE